MHKRTKYWLPVIAACFLVSIAAKLYFRDTLEKAAFRFGNAVGRGDTETIWEFVSENERDQYGFDKVRFKEFWSKICAERLTGLSECKITNSVAGGVLVGVTNKKQTSGLSFQVSGNEGEYVAPYLVAHICCTLPGMDVSPDKRLSRAAHCMAVANWLSKHEKDLASCGIVQLKRGPAIESQSIPELIAQYRRNQAEFEEFEKRVDLPKPKA